MKHVDLYTTYIKTIRHGWEMVGVSNLCAPSRGIPGRGHLFSHAPFVRKDVLDVSIYKNVLFVMKKAQPRLGIIATNQTGKLGGVIKPKLCLPTFSFQHKF